MNAGFEEAERIIKEIILDLQTIISTKDGEDLSYYNPIMLDEDIQRLTEARSFMAVGRYMSDETEKFMEKLNDKNK